MSEETKKKYKVLKPVAISGIVDPGDTVELTESEAKNIGISTYLEDLEPATNDDPEPSDEGNAEGKDGESKEGSD